MNYKLAFYGGARTSSDNGAFKWAAKNTQASYGSVYTTSLFFAKSAKFIIDQINKQTDNSIGRLDIITHASATACYMVRNIETKASGLATDIPNDKKESNDLYASSTANTLENGWNAPPGDEGGTIYDFENDKFATDAVIEFHGCRIADSPEVFIYDNIAENLSEQLYDDDKTSAVVIGHATKADPKINGEDTTTEQQQDYRHKERIVYHNGEVLFRTKVKRHIGKDIIKTYLDKKTEKEESYNGKKEVYTK
ncbi:hypothetical protein BH11BAC7_BH11BAC7_25290 [soil metagenome]